MTAKSPKTDIARFRIRPAIHDDLVAVMALEERGFAHSIQEPAAVFLERIDVFSMGFLIATDMDAQVLGYICSEIWPYRVRIQPESFALGHSIRDRHTSSGTELYISSMAVSPTARGQGLGLRLLSDCLQRAVASHPLITSAILLVNERWTSAARIYRQLGFAEIEAFTQFFTNADGSGSDGHVMRKWFTSFPCLKVST